MAVPNQHSILVKNVLSLISKKVDETQAPLVTEFAQILFQTLSQSDLHKHNDSDLYGAVLSLWNKFSRYQASKPHVQAFNPEISKNGWHSAHTIVEILVKDMPFLVDSVRMALNRLEINTHLLLHTPISLKRDDKNQLVSFVDSANEDSEINKETVFLIEIDHQTTQKQLDRLTEEILSVVDEVSLAVADWQAMRSKLTGILENFDKSHAICDKQEAKEAKDFLKWISNHNFTLMGYRGYTAAPIEGDYRWLPENESSLGLMKNSVSDRYRVLSNIPHSAREEALSLNPLMLTKTNSKARVHRPAYMDYIGIKRFDAKGNVIGEDRFLGLYSASFYNSSATQLPILQSKIERMCQLSGLAKGSHAYKAFMNIVETYPRDELLQGSEKELSQIILEIFQMQERGISRVFVRKDKFGRSLSCMVYMPREKYNTELRRQAQALLKASFGSQEQVEFTTYFSESVYARTHYFVRVKDNNVDYDVNEIENNIIELSKTWNDRLATHIRENHGEGKGKALESKYGKAFSASYTEKNLPGSALVDIEKLEELNYQHKLGMLFYRPQEEPDDSAVVKLKLFHKNEPIHLSDVLPMLENFGLRVIDERPYQVTTSENQVSWIMDFSMLHTSEKELDMQSAQTLFQDAFARVWSTDLEDDGFNRLVLSAGLTGRKVTVIRAYAKYMRQTGSSFSINYIANTMSHYPDIATRLVALFEQRFSPQLKRSDKQEQKISGEILEQLDSVSNLDDDRIIRRYLDMILATLRTNFYQTNSEGKDKAYISFKLLPELIPEMPLPLPKFEIFVYSPRVEGVHLRGGKVARGGLRWSDRQEDFRSEILGLVKAQQVKNTVIVPVGAKGGFVCKKLPTEGGREAFFAEGQACYRIFIRSLLDITDNIVDGKVVHPDKVVCLDDEDPYLVVAADKGTATFSDIANGISEEFQFWLGDAFASGGSIGYDHKKMGITARGAWESVKRHFREMGVDCQTTDFTCLAVGDMAGDVFGNGMLLSKHTRLVCAFNHLHIFFDPDPDAKTSYKERQRLFKNPKLNWQDYDKSLISNGGGVFERSAKSISLTSEMKKWLNTRQQTMTPTELIHKALQMPVDLIWNGGIGTYVKGSEETHMEVGDRANDDLRVNGRDLQAKIVGEGGNLGLTQLGRIEYCANGGRANTDFIDNVSGVDCSDNEVNIKILLNALVRNGDLTIKQRNELLYDMTNDVAKLVIDDCYRQTLSMSISQLGGVSQLKEQLRFINGLEKEAGLNRKLEFIPTDEVLSERLAKGAGLTRPELSVLISYGKMMLKESFNIPEIISNPYHRSLLVNAFPQVLRERFESQMDEHPLRSEIIATKLANNIVNDMGLNFVFRTAEETGASVDEIATAYSVVKGVFNIDVLWSNIQALDNKISADIQLEMLSQVRRVLRRSSRWYLRHGDKTVDIESAITSYKASYQDLTQNLENYMVESEYADMQQQAEGLIAQGVPKDVAYQVTSLSNLFCCLDLAQVAETEKRSISLVANLYFKLGHRLELHWFLEQINKQTVSNHWQALARASYREELDWQQRSITSVLLKNHPEDEDADHMLEAWMSSNELLLQRWRHMMAEFKTSTTHEFAKFSVALREIMLLSINASN